MKGTAWYRSDIRNKNDYITLKMLENNKCVKLEFLYLEPTINVYSYFKVTDGYNIEFNNNSIDLLLNKPRGLKRYNKSLDELYDRHREEMYV